MVCYKLSKQQQRKTFWTVEVENCRTPIIDTISVIDPQEVDRRFANGDLCFIVHDGQRCLGFTWAHTGDCYIRGAAERLTLDPHSVYLYNIFTVEEMRGKGIYDAIQEKFFRYYKEKQVMRVYAMIEKDNLIIKNILLKAGFMIKTHIHYVRYHKAGIRYVYDYEANKMTVQFIAREPKDCTII